MEISEFSEMSIFDSTLTEGGIPRCRKMGIQALFDLIGGHKFDPRDDTTNSMAVVLVQRSIPVDDRRGSNFTVSLKLYEAEESLVPKIFASQKVHPQWPLRIFRRWIEWWQLSGSFPHRLLPSLRPPLLDGSSFPDRLSNRVERSTHHRAV
jgi:hypothetical protein